MDKVDKVVMVGRVVMVVMVEAAKSGRRVQLVPIPDRDEGRGTNDQNCNFSSCTILGHHKEQKKFFFFFSQSVDRKCQSDDSAESLTGLSKRPS